MGAADTQLYGKTQKLIFGMVSFLPVVLHMLAYIGRLVKFYNSSNFVSFCIQQKETKLVEVIIKFQGRL